MRRRNRTARREAFFRGAPRQSRAAPRSVRDAPRRLVPLAHADMHVRYDERSKTLGLAYYSEATPTGHAAPVTAAPATADKMAFPALLQTASSAEAAPSPRLRRRRSRRAARASTSAARRVHGGHGKCAARDALRVRPRLERRRLLERLQREVRPRRLRRPELRGMTRSVGAVLQPRARARRMRRTRTASATARARLPARFSIKRARAPVRARRVARRCHLVSRADFSPRCAVPSRWAGADSASARVHASTLLEHRGVPHAASGTCPARRGSSGTARRGQARPRPRRDGANGVCGVDRSEAHVLACALLPRLGRRRLAPRRSAERAAHGRCRRRKTLSRRDAK